MPKAMSSQEKPTETGRQWLPGLVVVVATIVSYVGFARVSVEWTLAISTAVLIGLVVFLWSVGHAKQRERRHRRDRM